MFIHLIGDHFRQKGHGIYPEGKGDVDIVKAAITMSSYKSTTITGEESDLLVLLFYLDCRDLYLNMTNTKKNPEVHNIQVLKQFVGDDVCSVCCLTMNSLVVTLL